MPKKTPTPTGDPAAAAKAAADIAEAKAREATAKVKTAAAEAMSATIERLKPKAFASSYPSTQLTRLRRPALLNGRAPRGVADQHLDPKSHDDLRTDSQHLFRSSPTARGMIRRLAESVYGGDGPKFQSLCKDATLRKAIEAWYADWSMGLIGGGCEIRGELNKAEIGLQRIETAAVDGDLLGVFTEEESGTLQLIESQRLGGVYGKGAEHGGGVANVVSGVAVNKFGRHLAYHVLPNPVTSPASTKIQGKNVGTWVDAGMARLWTCPLTRRINQTRGEPALAATTPYFEQIDDWLEASLLSARMAAYLAIIVKTDTPSNFHDVLVAQAAAKDPNLNDGRAANNVQSIWEPGSVLPLKPGESAETMTPNQPAPQLESAIKLTLKIIGCDLGMPLVLTLLDASETNFHGFKAAINNAYRGFKRWQMWSGKADSEWIIWRLSIAIASGELERYGWKGKAVDANDDWWRHKWIFPPPPMIDARAEIEAAALAVEKKIKSRKDAIAEVYGGDLDELYEQLEYEAKEEDRRGIKPALAPGTPGAGGAGGADTKPASTADKATPTDETT